MEPCQPRPSVAPAVPFWVARVVVDNESPMTRNVPPPRTLSRTSFFSFFLIPYRANLIGQPLLLEGEGTLIGSISIRSALGQIYWVFTGFYRVLLSFSLGFTGFYLFLLGFSGFYRVLPSFTGFYFFLLGFIVFYCVLLGFTVFYFFLLLFTGFHWVLLGFTGFY